MLVGDISDEQFRAFDPVRRKLKLRRGRGIKRISVEDVLAQNRLRSDFLAHLGMYADTIEEQKLDSHDFDATMRESYERSMGCSYIDLRVLVIEEHLHSLGVDGPYILPDEFMMRHTAGYVMRHLGEDVWFEQM